MSKKQKNSLYQKYQKWTQIYFCTQNDTSQNNIYLYCWSYLYLYYSNMQQNQNNIFHSSSKQIGPTGPEVDMGAAEVDAGGRQHEGDLLLQGKRLHHQGQQAEVQQ